MYEIDSIFMTMYEWIVKSFKHSLYNVETKGILVGNAKVVDVSKALRGIVIWVLYQNINSYSRNSV